MVTGRFGYTPFSVLLTKCSILVLPIELRTPGVVGTGVVTSNSQTGDSPSLGSLPSTRHGLSRRARAKVPLYIFFLS